MANHPVSFMKAFCLHLVDYFLITGWYNSLLLPQRYRCHLEQYTQDFNMEQMKSLWKMKEIYIVIYMNFGEGKKLS